jgi:gamma-glutamyltranspeptidase / glutathione hydrolase
MVPAPRALVALLLALAAALGILASPLAPARAHGRGPIGDGTGLVSAAHPLAAEAGAEMLRRGGTAVDAAAATQFALNVVEPQSSGLGGGGFMLLYLAAADRVVALDGREAAPAAATADQFLGPDGRPLPFEQAHLRGTAVGVPGTLALVAHALERYGSMPLAETLGPALELAEQGFRVDRFLAADLERGRAKLAAWPASAAAFLPDGRAPREGDLLRQPDLAETFRLLQRDGPAAFYAGELAAAIVAAQARRGGRMTPADLAAYRVVERAPVLGSYRGYRIASMPPPSSGGLTLVQLLQLLEPFDLRAGGHNAPRTLHLMVEAMHLAYADRGRYMGDADFVAVPARGLLDPAYVDARRALIDPARANPAPGPGDPFAYEPAAAVPAPAGAPGEDGPHTTHVTIVDGAGNVVSFTTTIEAVWGSGLVVPGYGFLLNNELTDFDFAPGGANQVEPGKRPRSSMTPTIAFRAGQPAFALGSPGGAAIIATVLQVFLNVVEHGLGVQDAIDAGRIFSPSYPTVAWEASLEPTTLAALRALGHVPAVGPAALGAVQAAWRGPGGAWVGGADARRAGTVVYVPPAAGGPGGGAPVGVPAE